MKYSVQYFAANAQIYEIISLHNTNRYKFISHTYTATYTVFRHGFFYMPH
jgi:hypothetical protein